MAAEIGNLNIVQLLLQNKKIDKNIRNSIDHSKFNKILTNI